jgi:hypothetical protein
MRRVALRCPIVLTSIGLPSPSRDFLNTSQPGPNSSDSFGAIRTSRDSDLGDERTRPPSPANTTVAGAEGHTHVAKVWALSIVQGPPRPKP